MITDTATTPPSAPDLEDGVEVEVVFTNDGSLALVWPDGRANRGAAYQGGRGDVGGRAL